MHKPQLCVLMQVEEAVTSYHRLEVATTLESSENKLRLQGPRRAAIAQLAAVLKLRIQVGELLSLCVGWTMWGLTLTLQPTSPLGSQSLAATPADSPACCKAIQQSV